MWPEIRRAWPYVGSKSLTVPGGVSWFRCDSWHHSPHETGRSEEKLKNKQINYAIELKLSAFLDSVQPGCSLFALKHVNIWKHEFILQFHLLGRQNSGHSSCSHHPGMFKSKWVLLSAKSRFSRCMHELNTLGSLRNPLGPSIWTFAVVLKVVILWSWPIH